MEHNVEKRLEQFQKENNVMTKGPLALVVQLTRSARSKPYPLDSNDFLTENKGQVAGLGGSKLKKILREHDIMQTLAAEGGRTSRGNMGLMIKYIEFLNDWMSIETIDFDGIEAYWAEQIRKYFQNQPFVLTADPSRTIGASFSELFDQARKRQKENPGVQYLGTVLQHLVAAKLLAVLPSDKFEIHGASVADAPTDRSGDFVINKTVLHCTTAPSEALVQKCKANIQSGYSPIIITVFERVRTAHELVSDAELTGRIEIWDIQQYLSTNIIEHSLFGSLDKNIKLANIIQKYNEIIDRTETDPSLRIEFESK